MGSFVFAVVCMSLNLFRTLGRCGRVVKAGAIDRLCQALVSMLTMRALWELCRSIRNALVLSSWKSFLLWADNSRIESTIL